MKFNRNLYSVNLHDHFWFIFIFALVIRLLYIIVFYYPGISEEFADDKAYMNIAENLLQQGFWLSDLEMLGSYSGVVGPGIGWILYPVVAIFGSNWLAVFIYVAVGSAFIPVLIYKLAGFLYNQRVALFAAFMGIIYVPFIRYTLSAGKDIWMTLFLLLVVYVLLRQKNKWNGFLYFLLIGFLYTFLFHLDERFLIFAPFILLFFLSETGLSPGKRYLKAITFTSLVVLMTIPWVVRNYQVYDRVILISVRTAPYTEKIFGYEPVEYFPAHEGRWKIPEATLDSIKNNQIENPDQLKKIKTPQQIDAIKKGILPEDFTYWETVWSSFINFWEPIDLVYSYYQTGHRFDGRWSLRHNLSVGFTYGVMLLFSLVGLFYLYKRNKSISNLFLIILIIYMSLHIFLIPFTNSRYRLPLEPIIIIYGSYGLIKALSFFNNKIRKVFFGN